ncbi:MAG: dihydroneopterin aldolase [Eubacteriaceae bacterium]|nr:dihydroneopterin aldolase [Eubacteriaceae bacterium]
MDSIIMKNMAFFGYHGVMNEEKVLGQKFFIDVQLFADLEKAGRTDNVTDTIHYGMVYSLIKDTVENERYGLIEALAERICSRVLHDFPLVSRITVRVKKPEAPVPGIFDYMGVEIERKRM